MYERTSLRIATEARPVRNRQQVVRKEIPTFFSTLATIRPIRTYVRLVRTNGNAGRSGDVLCICPHLISRSSPFEVNFKCFTTIKICNTDAEQNCSVSISVLIKL
jgi:hypothetical protein